MNQPIIEQTEALRIIGIDIRDFKRLVAFNLTLDDHDNLVTIGGDNGNGKSSVLDAIESTLMSIPREITQPVHEGADSAAIRITLGTDANTPKYKVIRQFDSENRPQGVRVVDAETNKAVPTTPQQFLKELIGTSFARPVDFINAQPKEQRSILARVMGLNFDEIDGQIAALRSEEKRLDEHQQKLQARVETFTWHEDVGDEEISVSELSEQLNEVHKHNAKVDSTTERIENKAAAIRGIQQLEQNQISAIERIKRELAEAESRLHEIGNQIKAETDELESIKLESETLQRIDTSQLKAQIDNAESTNRKIRENQQRLEARDEWVEAETVLKSKVAEIRVLQDKKLKMLQETSFPVEGLAFADDGITYQSKPFSQASQAEMIKVAVGVSLAKRGKCSPILIEDASLIGKKMLRDIVTEATKHGAQVFAEVVANFAADGSVDRDCSVYIVDGEKLGMKPEVKLQEVAI